MQEARKASDTKLVVPHLVMPSDTAGEAQREDSGEGLMLKSYSYSEAFAE